MTRPFKYTPEQEAWLVDLETTTARQAKSALHAFPGDARREGYCCLGRACVTLGIPEVTANDRLLGYFDGESGVLPNSAVEILDLRDPVGVRTGRDMYLALTDMNDEGKTFKEIAAKIRSYPWAYFVRDANGPEGDKGSDV